MGSGPDIGDERKAMGRAGRVHIEADLGGVSPAAVRLSKIRHKIGSQC